MGKYFGTDGIRGIANDDLTFELAAKVGNAITLLKSSPNVVIGTDTRVSRDMLKAAVMSGILAGGGNVLDLGILTTPGISYITTLYQADYGVVISASHNPPEYNGIKIFDSLGAKLSEEERDFIEECINKNSTNFTGATEVGKMEDDLNSHSKYCDFLAASIDGNLNGIKVVLDCSNGAAYEIAPKVFEKLGAEVICYNCNYGGEDINEDCGSLHCDFLAKKTVENKADIGFAFDGDADRVIAADSDGEIINGDSIVYILAKFLQSSGKLNGNNVVGTHHTNMGMEISLQNSGIKLIRADVGDHFVACEMNKCDCVLGGEQSGHIILKNYAPTGDGILAALQLVNAIKKSKKTIKELNDFTNYPQSNKDIAVNDKYKILGNDKLKQKAESLGKNLKGVGRLLIRASGTEPKIRIMAECKDETLACNVATELYELVKKISEED